MDVTVLKEMFDPLRKIEMRVEDIQHDHDLHSAYHQLDEILH